MGTNPLTPRSDLVDESALLSLATFADRLLAGRHATTDGAQRRRHMAGDGRDFLDHQPYTPGNDPRMIDWRTSARTDHPLVRRYAREDTGQWYVILDASASMGFPTAEKWELARRLTAAFLFLLVNRGTRVGLLTFGDGISGYCPVGRGRAQFTRALSVLTDARLPNRGGKSRLDACLPYMSRHHSAVIISDFLSPDGMKQDLLDLRGTCTTLHALQVVGSPEAFSDGIERHDVEDAETGETLTLEWGHHEIEVVRQRLANHVTMLGDTCRSFDIAFTPCSDTQDWRTHMVRHLGALRPGHI